MKMHKNFFNFTKGNIVEIIYLTKFKNNKNVSFIGTILDIKGTGDNKTIKIKRKIKTFYVYFTFLLNSPYIKISKL